MVVLDKESNNQKKKESLLPHQIDFKRQRSILDPDEFNNCNLRVDVIGAGATGSYLVLQLAKLGLLNIHIWDNDIVESHNLPNQLYGIPDIGKPKVECLRNIVKQLTGIEINIHNEFVTKDTKDLGNVVFILTDSMSSRREIYENCLKYNPKCELCIETRLAATNGRIYTFNPTDMIDQQAWESTLYSDVEAERSECGTTLVMGASSSLVASMATWQLIKWYGFKNGKLDVSPEFELMLFTSPKMKILNINDL